MGLLDTVKGLLGDGKAKLQDTVATHADSIKGGIDKAGTVVDDKTGGKYTAKVTTAQEKGKELVDGLSGDKPGGGPPAGGSSPDGDPPAGGPSPDSDPPAAGPSPDSDPPAGG